MLIGWYLFSAAAAEEATARAAAALAGVTPHADLAPTWSAVSDFVDQVVARARQTAFAVVDPGGRLRGPALAPLLQHARSVAPSQPCCSPTAG
jgi:hypothetical protein